MRQSVIKVYDPVERAVAAAMERERRPYWVIWWGVGSQRYWAIPCWRGATVPLVDAPTDRELRDAMRWVEGTA
ncbi:hypothetical protein [Thermomonospora umbrina]|uniref:Uncharacterized protein n=1 Tax=Thermomonospora umbrina TaxID=111806 RepID=A0A3D9STW5_9ACTN|nr:hypothetical protein [Thermomonospora umbrina]REE97463.1 hypothetical protein DFJ69_2935 [Thermomonospora umbrina]